MLDPNRHQVVLKKASLADPKKPRKKKAGGRKAAPGEPDSAEPARGKGKKHKTRNTDRTDDEIERDNQRRDRAAHEARRYDTDQMHRRDEPDADGYTMVVRKRGKWQGRA